MSPQTPLLLCLGLRPSPPKQIVHCHSIDRPDVDTLRSIDSHFRFSPFKGWFCGEMSAVTSMTHFHSAVYGDREDLTILWEDADVSDRSTVAFQYTRWLPEKKSQSQRFWMLLIILKKAKRYLVPHPEKWGFHMRMSLSIPPETSKLCFSQRSKVLTPLWMTNTVWSHGARSCGVQLSWTFLFLPS